MSSSSSSDKTQNKSFGFRISSIFNQHHTHSHSSQHTSQPNDRSIHKSNTSPAMTVSPNNTVTTTAPARRSQTNSSSAKQQQQLPTPVSRSSTSNRSAQVLHGSTPPPQTAPNVPPPSTRGIASSAPSNTTQLAKSRQSPTPPRSPDSQNSRGSKIYSPGRRKPPPDFDVENLYFQAPNIVKTSPSPLTSQPTLPKSNSQSDSIDTDKIADLEKGLDSFLNLNSSDSDSLSNKIEYPTNDSIEDFKMSRSSPLMGLSDFAPNYNQLNRTETEDSNRSDNSTKIEGTSLPYPAEMSFSELSSPVKPMFDMSGLDLRPQGSSVSDISKSPSPHETSLTNSRSSTPTGGASLDNASIGSSDLFISRQHQQQQQFQQQPSAPPYPPTRHSTGTAVFPRSPSRPSQTQQFQRHASEPMSFGISKSNTVNTYTSWGSPRSNSHRRQSSSVSSIWSSNSYRNVNLAAIKKTMNLKPGEGERSNYVLSIRRSSGTSYNENGPSKWKLPVGILPVDKSALYDNSNGRYLRLAGASAYRKKTSGVELKHGHLKPRLLAAEIDEYDDNTSLGLSPSTNTTTSGSGPTAFTPTSRSNKSSESSKTASRENSIARTVTDASMRSGGDNQSFTGLSARSTRSDSMGSSSSEDLADKIDVGYYQHRGYKYDKDGKDVIFDEEIGFNNNEHSDLEGVNEFDGEVIQDISESEDYDEAPKLVLANPDADTDSD
ncbi:uncharacterized protein J8A68_000632 [[Candida] subhashii]|uniref:Uncharacterized protein n=1 Tax=[Candida] subhashii TaxID=561895 RepID=A0A8J5UUA3_9ASCO|nr:uncharacterized protein J8A68_000632 [[Candida] subhashii]KAG7665807.1 hypothetical protein J8A68_000632 [[Candida] subhashii]